MGKIFFSLSILLATFCLYSSSIFAQGTCQYLFSPSKSKYMEKVDSAKWKSNFEYFRGLKYQELVLLRPLKNDKESILAYMEALIQSFRGPLDGPISKLIEKSDLSELNQLLTKGIRKNIYEVDKLESVLGRILNHARNKNLSQALKERIVNLGAGKGYSTDLFYLKLWTDPLWKVFEDFGMQRKEFRSWRKYSAALVRASMSMTLNSLSLFGLDNVSLLSDGFNFNSQFRKPLVKDHEYMTISLFEIRKRFVNQYSTKINRNKVSKVFTKLIHRSFVVLLSLHLTYTHLPVEQLVMSRTDLQKEVVVLEMEARKREGRLFTREEFATLELALATESDKSLVSRKRQLELFLDK